jgi:hypothetical protein
MARQLAMACVKRIVIVQNFLETPEHGAGAFRICYLLYISDGIDGYFYFQVTFNAGNRVYGKCSGHCISPQAKTVIYRYPRYGLNVYLIKGTIPSGKFGSTHP